MPVKFLFNQTHHKAWVLCHQCHNMVTKCEEFVLAKVGLTPQQYSVLMAIKFLGKPATPTDVARWLDRNTNSITLIVDRMERDGLVTRARDLRDRRSLRLVMTKKGEELLERASVPAWELVQNTLSCLSEEELQTLCNLIEKVRGSAFQILNPGKKMEEVPTSDKENINRFMARVKNV